MIDFSFGAPGIMGQDTTGSTPNLSPEILTGAASSDIVAASKDYEFFMPYILAMTNPSCQFEPITQCMLETGKPTRHFVVLMPEMVFDVGGVGRDLGLDGNHLHAFFRDEWAVLSNFISSVALYDPNDTSRSIALVLQRLPVRDPISSDPSRVVMVNALAVASLGGAYLWKATNNLSGPQYAVTYNRKFNAASLTGVVGLLLQGDSNPVSAIPNQETT
jgi:hypothetical protein